MTRGFHRKLNKFFRWSTRKTGTDTRYLTLGGFWVGLTRGWFIIGGFILSVAFANLLSPETFGTYQFLLSIFGIASAFTLTGIGTVVMQETSKGICGMLKWGFKKRLLWSLSTTIILLIGALYYFLNENLTLSTGLLIIALFAPFFESFKLYRAYLVGKQEFKKNALYSFIYQLVPLLALLLALFSTNNVLIIISTYFSVNTLVSGFLFLKTLKLDPVGIVEKDKGRTELSYSKHLSLIGVVGQVAGNLDKILIFHFLGATSVALYAFAVSPPRQIRGLNKVIETLLSPRFPSRTLSDLKKTVPKKALVLFIFTLLLVLLYIFIAPILFKTFYPKYLDAVIYSQVYALIFLTMPNVFFTKALIAHKKKKELYIIKVIMPIVRIILFSVLIPIYGIWGLIGVAVGVKFATSFVILYMFSKIKS